MGEALRHYVSTHGVNGRHSEGCGILVNVELAMFIEDNSEYLDACRELALSLLLC